MLFLINHFCDIAKFAEEKSPLPFALSLISYQINMFYKKSSDFMNFLSINSNAQFLNTYLALFNINYTKYLNSMSFFQKYLVFPHVFAVIYPQKQFINFLYKNIK